MLDMNISVAVNTVFVMTIHNFILIFSKFPAYKMLCFLITKTEHSSLSEADILYLFFIATCNALVIALPTTKQAAASTSPLTPTKAMTKRNGFNPPASDCM